MWVTLAQKRYEVLKWNSDVRNDEALFHTHHQYAVQFTPTDDDNPRKRVERRDTSVRTPHAFIEAHFASSFNRPAPAFPNNARKC